MTAAPPTRAERHYPGVGGLRVIASTAVVATHAGFQTGAYTDDPFGRAMARMDVGVPLFFALSGFLLSRPLFRAAAEARPLAGPAPYLWRRALRVLPAYWIAVIGALVLLPANATAGLGDWLRHLLLAQVYVGGPAAEGLAHAWSLCTEAAFYVVLPFLVPALLRLTGGWRPGRLLAALGGLAVLGLVWAGVSHAVPSGQADLWLPGYAGWFAAGMAMAVLSVAPADWRPVRWAHELGTGLGTCWAAAAALFLIAWSPLAGPLDLTPATPAQAVTKTLLYTLIGALVLWPLVFGDQTVGRTRRVLASRPVAYLGEISYGIFLFHMPFLMGLYAFLGIPLFTGSFLLVFLATWAGGTLLAALSFRFVERPLTQRWRDLVPERRRDDDAEALEDLEPAGS